MNSGTQHSGILAHSYTLRFELPLCTPSDGGPSEGPSQKEGAAVHDATKRFEIETLLKAGLATGHYNSDRLPQRNGRNGYTMRCRYQDRWNSGSGLY